MDEAHAVAAPVKGRAGWRLLVDPRFGPYLVGKTLSLMGVWGHTLVCAVVAYQVTGSVTFVGLLSLAQFGPQMVFATWSGSVADRADRVIQVIVGRSLSCMSSVFLGIWCIGGLDRPGTVAVIVGTSLLMGFGLTIGGPAMMALVPSLVEPNEIAAAVRLDSLPMLFGRTVGPALCALLLAEIGPVAAFIAAGSTSLLFVLVMFGIRRGVKQQPAPRAGEDRSMRAALALVRAHPRLALLILGVTATAFGTDPSITLAPAIADANGVGGATVGFYSGSFGLGAAIAVLGMDRLTRLVGMSRLVVGGLTALAAANLVLAFPVGLNLSMIAFACSGAGMSLAMTACTTLLQLAVSDEFRGRVMSLWLMGFVGSRPLAALLNGLLADLVSVGAALAFVAGVVALAAWLCRPARIASTVVAVSPAPDGRTR